MTIKPGTKEQTGEG